MAVSTVMSGSPTVWPLGRFDPATVLRLTREEGISVWGGGTTHIVRLLQHPDIETIDASQGQQHRHRWLRHPARRGPPDRGALPAPRELGVVGLRLHRDRTHQLGAGLDAEGRARLRRAAHAHVAGAHHRRRRHRGPARRRGQHRSPQLDVDARVLAQRRRQRRDRAPRPLDPHRRLRPFRGRHPLHRVAQARPDHPRRREHLPVRDRAPARRARRGGRGRGVRRRRSDSSGRW